MWKKKEEKWRTRAVKANTPQSNQVQKVSEKEKSEVGAKRRRERNPTVKAKTAPQEIERNEVLQCGT